MHPVEQSSSSSQASLSLSLPYNNSNNNNGTVEESSPTADVIDIDDEQQGINRVLVQDESETTQEERTNTSTNISNSIGSSNNATAVGTNNYAAERQVEVSDGAEDSEDGSKSEPDSDYSYDYEEEDDHYTSFIVTRPSHDSIQKHTEGQANNNNSNSAHVHGSSAAAVVPRDDIIEDGSGTVSVTANICAGRVISSGTGDIGEASASLPERGDDSSGSGIQYASLQVTKSAAIKTKSSWKTPSKKAMSMSVRFEKETTGGRRRLASDLYKIMMNDTEEAGFSVESADEEAMDKWTIKLFKFDQDSNLHKDMLILGLDHIEIEMNFPDQYPFEPPFVRVVRPRFKKQTGFVMNGALCMELLTNDGWNPINDIESVIVSIRSLLVVGDGRLEVAANMSDEKREELLAAAMSKKEDEKAAGVQFKTNETEDDDDDDDDEEYANSNERGVKRKRSDGGSGGSKVDEQGQAVKGYSTAEAKAAYSHLSSYHKKKGWSGWWAQRG